MSAAPAPTPAPAAPRTPGATLALYRLMLRTVVTRARVLSIGALGLVGGAAMVVAEDGAQRTAAAHRLNPDDEDVRELTATALAGSSPLVRALSEGGIDTKLIESHASTTTETGVAAHQVVVRFE